MKIIPATQAFGATLQSGQAEFRVWAPIPKFIMLRLERQGSSPLDIAMTRDGEDFVATAEAAAGDRYSYMLDGGTPLPDPVSRLLPDGVHGPTAIVDPAAFRWTDADWRGPELKDYILYELHVGTFTPQGTFDGVIQKLPYLKDLGITVIELMPITATPGRRNWGYDGVSPFAVQATYGGPDGLKRLVDAAHGQGLGVMLDVVFNHLGPEGNYLPQFGPYFTARHHTPWGSAVNYDSPGCEHVRRYVINNALYWVGEYHLDGLRVDAVQTIKDDSSKNILAEIQENVQALARQLGRNVCVIAETDENDARYVRAPAAGGYGLNAVWSDDFHHAVHAWFTGERRGYYQDFGKPEQIARALGEGTAFQGEHFQFWKKPRGTSAAETPLPANVICLQNHDQVGNRAKGERLSVLTPRGARKLAAALLLLAPETPLLFMGEEYDEGQPFQYFADFEDPALKKAVSEGRRREFEEFDFSEVPDPEDPATFERSKLSWAGAAENRQMLDWYRDLLRLRKQYVTQGARTADVRYSDGILSMQVPAKSPKISVMANLESGRELPPAASWQEVLRSDEDGYAVSIAIAECAAG